ncbi:MAG: hypothetical protein JO332_07960, partial [Planctomycetaceae bacterium]|nr:hypothetical protein [Planctomycetaceae bacterium]
VLGVHVRVRRIGDSSVHFEFHVDHKPDGRRVAEGRSVHSFIDSKTWHPTRVPDEFRAAVRAFEGSALDEKS